MTGRGWYGRLDGWLDYVRLEVWPILDATDELLGRRGSAQVPPYR